MISFNINMMRKIPNKFQVCLIFAFIISCGVTFAQSPKKLHKLAEKQKYNQLIKQSEKRIKKGARDSISYYYLTKGLLLKAENSNTSEKEKAYYSATKNYQKYIGYISIEADAELQNRLHAVGIDVYDELSKRKKRRRKYYAAFMASHFADTVVDYCALFPAAVNNQTLVTETEFTTPADVNVVQKNLKGVSYKIPERIPEGYEIIAAAETSIGTPWVWAGVTPGKGFDCSGFVMWAYQQLGYELPHRTKLLAQIGQFVQPDDFKASDIVCFGSKTYKPGSVWHVGMIHSVDGDEVNMIHCGTSTGVIVAPLSSGYWSESDYFVIRIE